MCWRGKLPVDLSAVAVASLRVCSTHLESMVPRTGSRLATKWGYFAVNSRKCMQASCIKQHAGCTVHKVATQAFLEPDRPVSEHLQDHPDDDALLRGNVPQPADWLRAWRTCRTLTSFCSAEAIQRTEAYIRGASTGSTGTSVTRKQLPQLVEVMAEVVRARIREFLRASWSISISIDDRKDYRIIRFRCDASRSGSKEGILAVFRQGGTASTAEIEDFDDDYSQKMCDSVLLAIDQISTPRKSAMDVALRDHIRGSIRHYVSDAGPGSKRCGHMLAHQLPNLIWCSRDPAHAVRIAARDPLHAVQRFNDQWESLFNGRHALVPDVMNSDVWRAKLVACQRRVVLTKGSQGPSGLETVLRHMSFAKQRFDSYAEPLRKVCCMLRAITMLLCHVAADARSTKEMRERAEAALRSFGPQELVSAGLTADYAAETLEFVRIFDCDDHDPAETPGQVRRFIRRMELLFCEGHILTMPPADAVPDGPTVPKTITAIVLEQCQDPEPIVYGDKVLVLWSRASCRQVSTAWLYFLRCGKGLAHPIRSQVGLPLCSRQLSVQCTAA